MNDRKKQLLDSRKLKSLEFEDDDKFDDSFQDDDLLGGNSLNPNFDFGDGLSSGLSPMDKHGDLLKELTNFNPFIRDKVNGWLGLIWSQKEEKYVENPGVTPIMNIKCANWCIDFLRTYTRDNNIITNISYDEYMNLYHDIVEVLWLNLGLRADEFGLRNNGDIKRVCVELEHAAILVLMGAGDGKYSKLLTETVNRNESIMSQLQPSLNNKKGTGLFSGLKNMFSR